MKKQLLILIVAIFAMNFTTVFGQAINGTDSRPTTCGTGDALHPIAGQSYNYSAIVNPTGGNFQWWAQKGTTFVQTALGVTTNTMASRLTVGAGELIATSASYGTTSATDNVSITWASSTLAGTSYPASPTFVAVQYDAPVAGCANNLKVFRIDPIFAFVVDITNVNHADLIPKAYDIAESQCVSKTIGATYDAGTEKMVMDYGADTLYFEVIAANFTSYWIPSFHLDGLLTGQSASMTWSYSNTFTPAGATYPSQNGTTTSTLTYGDATHVLVDPATNTNLGVSIYVMVIVQNQHNENIAGQNITLSVEGVNADGAHDVLNSTCAAPASQYEDLAVQSVNPRPTVTPGAGSFITPTTP
jgi:hypothetical protein